MTVTSTARLHFGFLDPSGRGPRCFGSLGMALDRPRLRLTLRRSSAPDRGGWAAQRARRMLERLANETGGPRDFAIRAEGGMPRHAGLGSGTQIALPLGSAYSVLTGGGLALDEIARMLGRGKRSGIGIGAFRSGGVLLDAGHGPDTDVPPIIARIAFPDAWRVLLIFDDHAHGVHGGEERLAFQELPSFPEEATADLCRRMLLHALPALVESKLTDFSAELRHLQQCMGDYFAPIQGGRYTSRSVAEALALIEAEGVIGVGQSSWGPTGFAVLDSEAECLRLREKVAPRAPAELRFDIARGLNRGARIETHAAD